MRNKLFASTTAALLTGLTLLTCTTAQGASLKISNVVDQITIKHDPNWTFGVTSNGEDFGPRISGMTTALGQTASFSGSWYVNSGGNPDPGQGIVYFVDNDDSQLVRHIIEASWSTQVLSGFDRATIQLDIQTSTPGSDLGQLPNQFAAFGISEPFSDVLIITSFRDPTSAEPVSIPSNLTVYFASQVPEPTTFTLLGFGSLALVLARRNRR